MYYITKYHSLRLNKINVLRNYLKNSVISVLSYKNNYLYGDQLYKIPRVQFLYFHHLFDDEVGKLQRLIEKLSKYHHFISYSDAVKMILESKTDKPYIVFSSDDGFKNNLKASNIFNDYGIKACFFINPVIIDEEDYSKVNYYCTHRLKFPTTEFLSWNDIDVLLSQGHEIGSHTMEHINIAQSPIAQVKEDIENSYNLLSRKCGKVEHFTFPYGKFSDFNDLGRQIVFDTGFVSCASAERGCHVNAPMVMDQNQLCIRRDHIVFAWKLENIMYFIGNNSRKSNYLNNYFPY